MTPAEREFALFRSKNEFVDFITQILSEELLLRDIVNRPALRGQLLSFHFEQVGFTGPAGRFMGDRVVLLRIYGELFAVGLDESKKLKIMTCDQFLETWSYATGKPREEYNTVSSIQPYTRALISKESLRLHGLNLEVEDILGQGLEGTVFLVREVDTGEHYALKKSYKDLESLYRYWHDGFALVRQHAFQILPYLDEFYSYESRGEKGSTLLMQYKSLTALPDALKELSLADRLRKGLKVLADAVRVMRTLWGLKLQHGDVGVANIFLYSDPDVEGEQHTMLIDPLPEVVIAPNKERYFRKDFFSFAHALYWLVTDTQWPPGMFEYLQEVMDGNYDYSRTKYIFNAPVMGSDPRYEELRCAAVRAMGGVYGDVLDLITATANELNFASRPSEQDATIA